MDLIVTHDFDTADFRYTLPKIIELRDVQPGESKYMRKRKRRVIRIHKHNSTKDSHE